MKECGRGMTASTRAGHKTVDFQCFLYGKWTALARFLLVSVSFCHDSSSVMPMKLHPGSLPISQWPKWPDPYTFPVFLNGMVHWLVNVFSVKSINEAPCSAPVKVKVKGKSLQITGIRFKQAFECSFQHFSRTFLVVYLAYIFGCFELAHVIPSALFVSFFHLINAIFCIYF